MNTKGPHNNFIDSKDHPKSDLPILHHLEWGESGLPLIILHGLFGSSRNWVTIGKTLSKRFRVFALDLRNHGDSFHSPVHTVEAMAGDVIKWLEPRSETGSVVAPVLLGHSMGGLVAAYLACLHPDLFRALIVADIAPRPYAPNHEREFAALRMDLKGLRNRDEIDREMAKIHPDPMVRRFLQMNLERTESGYAWKIHTEALEQEAYIARFTLPSGLNTFPSPTLFVRGSESSYVREEDLDLIRSRFPLSRIETIQGAGHWLHHTHQEEFLRIIEDFLEGLRGQK